MKRSTIVTILINLGYVSLTLQFLWLIVLLMPVFLDSTIITNLGNQTPVHETPIDTSPGLFKYIIAGIAVLVALLMGIYAVYKTPSTAKRHIDRTSSAIVQLTIPTLTHHKKISKKQHLVISRRLDIALKLSVSCIACIGLVVPLYLQSVPLASSIIMTVGVYLLIWTVTWFSSGYILGKP